MTPQQKKFLIPAIAVGAVLIIAGAGWGIFQFLHRTNSAPPPPVSSASRPVMPSGHRLSPTLPAAPRFGKTSPTAQTSNSQTDTPAHQVAALRAHLQQHPDIARVDYQTSNAGNIDITLRAGISDAQATDVARRIRQYMTATYPTLGDMFIGQITLHRHFGDDSRLHVEKDINEKSGVQTWHVVLNTVNGPRILD